MMGNPLPWLSLLILIPLSAAALPWLLPSTRWVRHIALGGSLVALTLALGLSFAFDATAPGFQFVEYRPWIPTLNIHYQLGIDGISVLFLPLTALLVTGVILASWNSVRSMPRLYFSMLLMMEGVTLGVFCALDTILFFLFWEMTLVPIYFLISLWGIGPNRRYAAVKYTLFMLAGGLPLLFGFLMLAFDQATNAGATVPAGLVFDYIVLLQSPPNPSTQVLVFFLLLIGFAIKTPVFPLHTWLPVAAEEGPVAVIALLTGLKLGAFGLMRFVVPLAPSAALEFHWLLASLGVTGILYGGVLALRQTNLRRMLAYASISHVGLVVLGIASFNLQGIQGALFLQLNFIIAAGGIFLLAGYLHHRTGSTDLIHLGGVAKTMPLLAGFFFLFGLAGLGVPGTSGFPGEFLILVSAIKTHTGAGFAALFGMILGAGYFLGLYRRTFLGPVNSEVVADAIDLRPRELLVAALFGVLIIAAGVYPQFVLDTISIATQHWVVHLAP